MRWNELPPDKLVEVVTMLSSRALRDSGDEHAPALMHDIVNRYETEANRF